MVVGRSAEKIFNSGSGVLDAIDGLPSGLSAVIQRPRPRRSPSAADARRPLGLTSARSQETLENEPFSTCYRPTASPPGTVAASRWLSPAGPSVAIRECRLRTFRAATARCTSRASDKNLIKFMPSVDDPFCNLTHHRGAPSDDGRCVKTGIESMTY
jgi:hypothetical protein